MISVTYAKHFGPKPIRDILHKVDISAYKTAKETGNTYNYWVDHYTALKSLEQRLFQKRQDVLPGIGDEWLFPVAYALGEVFRSCLQPIVPVEAASEEEKRTLTVAKGVAIYFVDEQNRLLQTGEVVTFDSLRPGGVFTKTIRVDEATPFGSNYFDDVTIKLFEGDAKVYDGMTYNEYENGVIKKASVKVERNKRFFAEYRIERKKVEIKAPERAGDRIQ